MGASWAHLVRSDKDFRALTKHVQKNLRFHKIRDKDNVFLQETYGIEGVVELQVNFAEIFTSEIYMSIPKVSVISQDVIGIAVQLGIVQILLKHID